MAAGLFSRPNRRINRKEVFIPGFGIKFPRSAYNNLDSAGAFSWGGIGGLKSKLDGNPNWRFVQFELSAGEIVTAPGVYNWTKLDSRIDELRSRGVKAGLMFQQREFDVSASAGNDVRLLLPDHLVSAQGTWSGAGTAHTRYAGCLGIEPGMGQGSGSRGYVLQYSDPMIQNWHREWFAAVAEKYDDDPDVMFVGTSEASYGTVTIPFGHSLNPESIASMQAGRIQMVRDLKAAFKNTAVYHDLNQTKQLAEDWYLNYAQSEHVWLSASNTHWNASTNAVASGGTPKGALRYYQDFSGILPKFAQWQGDDFDEINPATGVLHTMQDFHDRLTSSYIGASMCLIQYKLTAPSGRVFSDYDNFIKTLLLDGGLVTARPLYIL
ncbi:MAG: hypothetical protein ABTQ25_07920 [Nitrosomonas ureae]